MSIVSGMYSPTSSRTSAIAGSLSPRPFNCRPSASSCTPNWSTIACAGGGSAGRWASSHNSVRATICCGLPCFSSARLGVLILGKLENTATATAVAITTAITPQKPIPFTKAPAIPAPTQIAKIASAMLRTRLSRLFIFSSAEPLPMLRGPGRCVPPSRCTARLRLASRRMRSLSGVVSGISDPAPAAKVHSPRPWPAPAPGLRRGRYSPWTFRPRPTAR